MSQGNYLMHMTREEVMESASKYAEMAGLSEHTELFRKGAVIARDPNDNAMLTNEEREELVYESKHRWAQPRELYTLVVACSVAAAVQGMDETVINGANLFFPAHFGITSEWILGIVNSSPYLCCAVIGCWLSHPLNTLLGRRGTIFVCSFVAGAACIWSACTNSWWHLFIARFVLGFGIGAKSATVPVYAAECTPAVVRGALVMMWQMWTAFGIMLGYVADVSFYHVRASLNWRLMLGSAAIPAVFVCAQVYFCPESPRWYMARGEHTHAFASMLRLRKTKLIAARDLYYTHVLLAREQRGRVLDLFRIARNRRAAVSSFIVMFMQQFCGVNVISYYSSNIFRTSGFSEVSALLASFGFGLVNFLFAIPAIFTIDNFGRRNLLLTTFPLMALFLFFIGFSFYIPSQTPRTACVALGIYLFTMAYSPGAGPVPFTYSAEAFPLDVRDIGMSFATATCWFFNFLLSLTWPAMQDAFTPTGAFGWYAGWNLVGFVLVWLILPETKARTLEELDEVFSVPTRVHAKYQFQRVYNRWSRSRSSEVDEKELAPGLKPTISSERTLDGN